MMARKKRIAILSASIALTVLIIIGILIVLYLKTDAFKNKVTLSVCVVIWRNRLYFRD